MITDRQIKAARVLLGWEQRDLARRAGLSLPTVQRMERYGLHRSHHRNARKLQQAFETAGIEFINGEVLGLHLRALKTGS